MTGRVERALLYLRTARRLRWRQWVYRPVRLVQSRRPPPLPAATDPVDEARLACMAGVWNAAASVDAEPRMASAEAARAGTFSFAGTEARLAEVDWTARGPDALWTYHLHYFDAAPDLAFAFRRTGAAVYADAFRRWAGAWMDATRGGRGPGWEPYPLSLRTANWLRARALFGDALEPGFRARLDASVFAQLAVLERRLEWHILANHLQKNLHALVLGGLAFGGARAAGWRARGTRLLGRELREQVLPDGGHFERSPMYHAIALGDFLEAVAVLDACGASVPSEARDRVRAMAAAWTRLSRPDGAPELFNDAAEGVAPAGARLDRWAEIALGGAPVRPAGAWSLPDSGYHGWSGERGERIVVDCGPPGPGYQPGHAHCDLLSFVLDLGGRPVVVDSGVSGYAGDPLRDYVRSTRAHNTVSIAGREQSEVWGVFRVGRMASVRAARSGAADGGFAFDGSYHPYHDAGAVHRRTIRGGGGAWRVADGVQGAHGASLVAFLHLHADFDVAAEDGRWTARAPGAVVRIEPFGVDAVRLVRGERDPAQGWYCPRFGTALPAPVLELHVHRNDGREFGCLIRHLDE